MNHVLIISHDVVGAQMAGPGIRYYQLARELAKHFTVTLAVPAHSSAISGDGVQISTYQYPAEAELAARIRAADVVLVSAIFLARIPALRRSAVPIVVDGYNPLVAEWLSLRQDEASEIQALLKAAYAAGDFFICASERQRDWWLGLLEAHERINLQTFQSDQSLRQLVDVVPYGLPPEPPRHTRDVIRGVWPGIAHSDRVILWGGGLWPWLDPLTAIRAVAEVCRARDDVRLIFPGTRHPNPTVANGMPTHGESAWLLAKELGLLNRAVFFGEWIPFADWPNVLLESDLALTLHGDTVETRLAFRSRVLDYIWAGLPTIATYGDVTSQLVAHYGIGETVGYGAVEEVAAAISSLLSQTRGEMQAGFDAARGALSWERAAQPLVRFCREPRLAADKAPSGERCLPPGSDDAIEHLQHEKDYWQDLAARYEQGRFMRLMRWLADARQRFAGSHKTS